MSRQWMARQERGSLFLIRLIVGIARTLGRPVARLLLYPITAYFLLFSPRSVAASRDYLERVLPGPVGLRQQFRHYHTFAATILDRVFLLAGRYDLFDIRLHGAEVLTERLAAGHGCILLGAHVGSFEALRMLGLERQLPINVLMYEENAEKINSVLNVLNPRAAQCVIPIGGPESLLKVGEKLRQGELVGILGDRIAAGDKSVTVDFLGRPTRFPAGPLLIAGLLKAPVILGFGLYRGGNRYDLHFELLGEEIPLPRHERMAQVQTWTQRYAERLEAMCRAAPYNWFNFYDYWEEPADNADD